MLNPRVWHLLDAGVDVLIDYWISHQPARSGIGDESLVFY